MDTVGNLWIVPFLFKLGIHQRHQILIFVDVQDHEIKPLDIKIMVLSQTFLIEIEEVSVVHDGLNSCHFY